jgi:DNA polymerase-3 subunit epsilon/ATP-dependent DNA helicase DinG
LPFSVPTDPVIAARSEAFEDAFAGYAVPQAVLRFKQGFGRLIRSSSDRGVCAVLDRRILTKRYGATFLQSLPECTVEVGSSRELPRAAREWLPVDEGPAAGMQPLLNVEEG